MAALVVEAQQASQPLADIKPNAVLPNLNSVSDEVSKKGRIRWQAAPKTILPTQLTLPTPRYTKVRFS